MAKYKKRSDGRYATTLTVCINGEKKKKYICGKTIKEVDDKIVNLRSQDISGRLTDHKNITVAEYASVWLSRYKQDIEYNTKLMYDNAISKHIVPKIGNVRLCDLSRAGIQDMINSYLPGHRRTAEVVKLTINQMLECAIADALINRNACKGITLKKEHKEKRALTDDEIKRMMSAPLSQVQRAFVYTLLFTGLRRGEALALTAEDISDVLTVNKTLIFKDGKAEIKPCPKSKAGMRKIPIPAPLADALDGMNGILFPMRTRNEYMTHSAYVKFWKSIQKACDLPEDVTAHTLRHTYATKLYYSGIDVKMAQSLLGHANISVTLGIYTHLQAHDEDLKARLAQMYT